MTILSPAAIAIPDEQDSDSSAVDTILYEPLLDFSPAQEVTNPVSFEKHLLQNPTVALFKSMLIPGLGQIGNHRYLKAAVIVGLDAWFLSSAIHFGKQASDFRDQWKQETDVTRRNDFYNLFNDRRGRRNKFLWFAGILTFVSMFDAYVDAHLSGAPTDKRNDSFTVGLRPSEEVGAMLTFVVLF